MRSTQGKDGCCQAIQHWWNRLLGLVSSEFSLFLVYKHLTNLHDYKLNYGNKCYIILVEF